MSYKTTVLFIALMISISTKSQEQGKSYKDGHGKEVLLPLGDISFADQVVSFTKGEPAATELSSNPLDGLGTPDYDGGTKGFVSLGCGGALVLKFTNNALINREGPDLYVFEMGKYVESTELSISKNGLDWVSIGEITGAKAEVDIEKYIQPGDIFNYVRLIDLKTSCKGMWPGADIDAVAAIGAAQRISFTGSVLFNVNEAALKPEAKKLLEDLIKEIINSPVSDIFVEGYTDSLGTAEFNKSLSLARAVAVRDVLKQKLGKYYNMDARGFGASNPLFPNDTKEGQEKNRRVEIVLIPVKK